MPARVRESVARPVHETLLNERLVMTTRTNDIARLLGTLALACTLCATGDETNPETETPETETSETETPETETSETETPETGSETTETETPAVWTNVWTAAAGGTWFAADDAGVYTNWLDGAITNTAVSRFRLNDGATVRAQGAQSLNDWTRASSGGFDVGPAGETTAETAPAWRISAPSTPVNLYPATGLGYTPFHVAGGALTLVGYDDTYLGHFSPVSAYQRFRKTGDGTLTVQQFARRDYDRAQFTVAEGALVAGASEAFVQTDVRVADAGSFALAADPVRMGTLTVENDTTVDLGGRELLLGFTDASALPAGITGGGRVTAAVRDVVVTNPVATIEYGATAGRLRLDSATGRAAPYGRYDFETDLLTDASGQGRTLTMFGTVTRVWDEERQSWVARFDGSLSGLTATAPGSGLLSGDADYTVSFWAKAAQTPARNGAPTFYSIGNDCLSTQFVQGRFSDASCTNLVIGHWGAPGDFTGLTAPATPTAWHHYVISRKGSRVTLWIDGGAKVQERFGAFRLNLPDSSRFTIGAYAPATGWNRNFDGDLDDVCVYPFGVGAVGAARLYAGLDLPAQAGKPALDAAAPTLPEGLRLRTKYNGEIALAGGAEIAVTNVLGGAQRGGLVLPRGGTLTLTGPGRYDAEISGATDVVKAGADALTLGGRVNATGTTRVQQGTLRLESARTALPLYAHYDFEESLTADSGPERVDLETTNGVTRAWDEDRQSHVAVFSGAANQNMRRGARRAAFRGNADYTVSVWAKPDADCPAQGAFLSLGEQGDFREIVFRFNEMSAGSLVLSHWGGSFDYTDITNTGLTNPADGWHHYAATHSGFTFSVYCDGKLVWTRTTEGGNSGKGLELQTMKTLFLGAQMEGVNTVKPARNFKGRLDDVRVYTVALDAAAIARLAANQEPLAVASALSTPVAHWSFEDADDLGRDTRGAHPLTIVKATAKMMAFTRVASPLGGYAVQFPAESENGGKGGWLRTTDGALCTPGGNQPFSFSMWLQTSASDTRNGSNGGFQNPYFLTLGKTDKVGYLFGHWQDATYTWAGTRDAMAKEDGNTSIDICSKNLLPGLHDGDATLRWHHYARVYDPKFGLLAYVDGRLETDLSKVGDGFTVRDLEGFDLMLGGRLDKDIVFHGAIDEVRFYTNALTSAEVLAIMREDLARGRGVLPADAAVEIAADATLQVAGSDETVGTFAGTGALALESGRVTVTGTTTLEGALTGDGTLRVAAGAALTLAQAPTGFTGVFDLAGGALALPDGTANLAATFRASAIDGAAQATYPGAVEIPAGVTIALTEANHGPLVSTAGPVSIRGGGTVTLPSAKAQGTWVIARGASVTASAEALAAWTASNAAASLKVRFRVTSDGDFVCQALGSATVIMVR